MQQYLREREGRAGGADVHRGHDGKRTRGSKHEVYGFLLCGSQLSVFAARGTVLTACRLNVWHPRVFCSLFSVAPAMPRGAAPAPPLTPWFMTKGSSRLRLCLL